MDWWVTSDNPLAEDQRSPNHTTEVHIAGLVQDCSISNVLAMELQSCIKPLIYESPGLDELITLIRCLITKEQQQQNNNN